MCVCVRRKANKQIAQLNMPRQLKQLISYHVCPQCPAWSYHTSNNLHKHIHAHICLHDCFALYLLCLIWRAYTISCCCCFYIKVNMCLHVCVCITFSMCVFFFCNLCLFFCFCIVNLYIVHVNNK